MNWQTAAAAIRARFAAQVETGLSLTTVYDNALDTTPQTSPWCRLVIVPGQREYVESPNRSRTPGMIFVQLFVDRGTGTSTIDGWTDSIADEFQRMVVSGVVYKTPFVERVGADGKWFQVNLSIPFMVDDFS